MKLKLTLKYVLTFLALTFMMHEAHEIVHTAVGRLIIIMNTFLEKGFLSSYWILGSPIFVTIWTITMVLLFTITRKNIYKLVDSDKLE